MTTPAREAADRYCEFANGRDLEPLLALFADDAVVKPPTGDRYEGAEEIRAFYRDVVFSMVSNLQPTRFYEAGDSCVMEAELSAEWVTGPKPEVVDVFTVDGNGRITRLAVYMRQPR
jgi:ketosteroid isomerase-like protein